METRDTEQKEITEKFINQAIEGHRAHDLNWKRIPGFNVSVLEKDAVNRSCFYTLSMAVIFQGEKIVDVGDNQYQYGGGSMIVTSVEVPTSYRILNASPERPFVICLHETRPRFAGRNHGRDLGKERVSAF